MAKYKVIETSYINGSIVKPGAIVDVEFKDGGAAGPNLELVVAKKGKAAKLAETPSETTDESGESTDLT